MVAHRCLERDQFPLATHPESVETLLLDHGIPYPQAQSLSRHSAAFAALFVDEPEQWSALDELIHRIHDVALFGTDLLLDRYQRLHLAVEDHLTPHELALRLCLLRRPSVSTPASRDGVRAERVTQTSSAQPFTR
jgi:hypothetical protein